MSVEEFHPTTAECQFYAICSFMSKDNPCHWWGRCCLYVDYLKGGNGN